MSGRMLPLASRSNVEIKGDGYALRTDAGPNSTLSRPHQAVHPPPSRSRIARNLESSLQSETDVDGGKHVLLLLLLLYRTRSLNSALT
jgi:hypothetical protein